MEKKSRYGKFAFAAGLIWILAAVVTDNYVYFPVGCTFMILQ